MLGPELSVTSGRINARQVSSVALSFPRTGFSKPTWPFLMHCK